MSDPRRYDENEIAEILERATTSEGAVQPTAKGSGEGLTLEEIQEIGSEVGIAPARIADAAQAMASRSLVGTTTTFLGAPRSVSRIVPIDRPLNDDEWTRLVVDLRETFDAVGKVTSEGNLRTWRNGNLHVYVEPDGDRYRVRMRTHKGNVTPRMVVSAAFIFLALFMLVDALGEGATIRALFPALMFGGAGLGTLVFTRATLPGWALERADQMEGLAERIPLLLKE
ncbi:MAG: hypothetical protein HKO65_15360 [Gemmatimonadetes bacterium]|nr:hypothetical protein [Gemmatimonadota bacterium]